LLIDITLKATINGTKVIVFVLKTATISPL